MIGIATKSDQTTRQDVLDELKWDTGVDDAQISVEVDDGVVILTGCVDSHAKRIAAEQAAHRVVGIFDVVDEIKVQPPHALGRTDREIAHAVRRALDVGVSISGKPIETTVSKGWVTLRGEVDYWLQGEDAERAVLQVPGVLGVVNELSVRPQGWPRSGGTRREHGRG
jgi:osmotically-inducible protein OsmY